MRRILLLLSMLIGISATSVAQQHKFLRRSPTPMAFEHFREAKVIQPFGRFVKAKANIFLKNGGLLFVQNDTVMQADLSRILAVRFDSVQYMKVNDSQLGAVVMQQGYNYLLRVTTIDMDKYRSEHGGGEDLPYLDMNEMGMFLEIDSDSQRREGDDGYPLQDKYYFSINGQIIPANETQFKKFVAPDKKRAFKVLMNDKYWSWGDEPSLCQLFDYLK